MRKKKIFILLIGIFIMSLIGLATYAYFSAQISGNSNSNNVEVNMKDLPLLFSDETDEVSVENMSPGWTYEKTVTVTNNGENEITYDLVWLCYRHESNVF